MRFTDFSYRIKNSKDLKVKGLESQMIMAPKLRHRFTEAVIRKNNPNTAAVICLFYPDDYEETKFLLILRSHYDGTHASQYGFPGGKMDLEDSSLEETARREMYEEVGVPMSQVQIVRKMSHTYIPPSNFLVTPFIGLLTYRPQFVPNHEVAKIIEVPVKSFMSDSCISTMKADTSYAGTIETPCFRLEGAAVWGATAMMMNEIRELIKKI